MDWLTPKSFVILIALCFVPGSLVALVGPRSRRNTATRLSLGFSFLGGVVAVIGAATYWHHPMATGEPVLRLMSLKSSYPEIVFPDLVLSIYVDRLAAFFVFISGVSTILISIYSFTWLSEAREKHRIACVFNLFVMCTLMTVLQNNAYFYVLFLESMTLTFTYLMLYGHNKNVAIKGTLGDEIEKSKTAFKAYLIFSHIAIMLIIAGFLFMFFYKSSFDFDDLRKLPALPAVPASLIFLLTLLGFGVKAGMVPTHIWVSMVHPQSPTNIHSMMSGVILKIAGIYGMIRVFFEFLDPSILWWWGCLVLLLAGGTALVGVFYALLGHDLKTTLASHSVENMGIILVGIGMALIYSSQDFLNKKPFIGLANLALIASLYHILNHAVFKSLLFFCTGAIENRTGTVRFSDLDGLMRYYPWTSNAFLLGAVAISGFPPLNGFVSEWLTLQSIFTGINIFSTRLQVPMLISILLTLFLLSSAFGLTALAFVKILGEVFLGPPRKKEIMKSSKTGDVPWTMRSVLVVLSILCLGLGIFPSFITRQLEILTNSIIQVPNQMISYSTNFGTGITLNVETEDSNGTEPIYNTRLSERVLIFFLLIISLPVAWPLLRNGWGQQGNKPALGPIWTGGIPYDPESMQFTGTALTSLVWGAFGRRNKNASSNEDSPLSYRIKLTGSMYVPEIFRQGYDLLVNRILSFSQFIGDNFQNGDIRSYLWYIFAAFILVLLALFLLALGQGV